MAAAMVGISSTTASREPHHGPAGGSGSGGGSMSPSAGSSPRLPSPPPFPEVQTAPKSPLGDEESGGLGAPLPPPSKGAASKRIRPGTKAADIAKGPPLIPLSEINSPFQLQEYLKALHHSETHDSEGRSRPLDRAAAERLASAPEGVERSLWLYELCRLLLGRVNAIIVGFFADKCDQASCSEMRASEWQYLCAVHDPPKSCCAIDYCCHTLDWATNIITSQKHFPSRLTLGGDTGGQGGQGGGSSQQGIRQLTNIFRRVYRMFAHAWFQHRKVFYQVEEEEGLYLFYKTVCDVYSLMPMDTYTVPPEAEGFAASAEGSLAERARELATSQEERQGRPSIPVSSLSSSQELPLRPKVGRESTVIDTTETGGSLPKGASLPTLGAASTTKRHKHTPSTGSFVPPITEGDEEEEESQRREAEASAGHRDVPLDTTAMMQTVRYDPKDLHSLEPPPEDEDMQDDALTEVTVLINDVPEEIGQPDGYGLLRQETLKASGGSPDAQESKVKIDEANSPVTPIDEDEGEGEKEQADVGSLETTAEGGGRVHGEEDHSLSTEGPSVVEKELSNAAETEATALPDAAAAKEEEHGEREAEKAA